MNIGIKLLEDIGIATPPVDVWIDDHTLEATRTSILTQKQTTVTISAPGHNLKEDYYQWRNGDVVIQDALGYLDVDQREFLMTGITQDEWNNTFSEGYDDE